MKKTVLGLDLGTNSIGWALLESDFDLKSGKILGIGSRILPMDQGQIGDFEKGNKVSQTKERTGYRGTRRLNQRTILRRERLNRVLNVLDYLPTEYKNSIDFEIHKGQFIKGETCQIQYKKSENIHDKSEFIFMDSYNEMLQDFEKNQPYLLENNRKIPYNWTLFYLRDKALRTKISKEELSWILLNFNQKRGYFQLRDEEEKENPNQKVEYHKLKVIDCVDTGEKNKNGQILYKIELENGMSFIKPSKLKIDWKDKEKEFIITTSLEKDGSVKLNKDGEEKRSFRAPNEDDWTLVKTKTEEEISQSEKTVGTYIYNTILANPSQKIRGKLIQTIERKFYKSELIAILEKQKEYHKEFRDEEKYEKCIRELYPNNEAHRRGLLQKNLAWFLVNDIIFYQRPLKSKKSLIANCQYEERKYIKDGKPEKQGVKCAPKSHPLFQEFRMWQFVKNLKIVKREESEGGKQRIDVDVTGKYISNKEDLALLFDLLNSKKEIKQSVFLKHFKLSEKEYKWNYAEDLKIPCNTTRRGILDRLNKCGISEDFLTVDKEEELWHLFYSINSREELEKALKTFAIKNSLEEDVFVDNFKKIPSYDSDYASYSLKAIKKFLPLLRAGKYWKEELIDAKTRDRISKIIDGEDDEEISDRVRENILNSRYPLENISDFQGLPLYLACYVVYNRHSEVGEIKTWKHPEDIEDLEQHSLNNPIVEQVINETLRVVRDIWIEYGHGEENFFDEIHVELGREIKNPAGKRADMAKQRQENENTNVRIRAILQEMCDSGVKDVRSYSPMQQEKLKIYEEGIINSQKEIPDDIKGIIKKNAPSVGDIKKYKLWLEQGYVSPYTGKIIPLSDLFTRKYEIEHIIPQSLYFDDSMNNKIICETEVNKFKSNTTAYAMFLKHGGRTIELSFGESVELLSKEEYENHVKRYFGTHKTKVKLKNLLSEEPPEGFINRQLNDSRYISKEVRTRLSNILREEGEDEAISKHIVSLAGSITSKMKQSWGLNDVWNSLISPRFQRLNRMAAESSKGKLKDYNSSSFGYNTDNHFQIQIPEDLSRGFSKKRIDHRHHALDAIVIAATTKDHINYITSINTEKKNHSLVGKLREKIEHDGKPAPGNYLKPWETFTEDALKALEGTIVSFKSNVRVINKTSNLYEKWERLEDGQLKKRLVRQVKGDSWAIRKPLHKETVYGRISLQEKKVINLKAALEVSDKIVDKPLRKKIRGLKEEGLDNKEILKYFKKEDNKFRGEEIKKVAVYEMNDDYVAVKKKLGPDFNSSLISKVVDQQVRNILEDHLVKYENSEEAFSTEGIEEMNKGLVNHKPIYSVRVYDVLGLKFNVGLEGNSKDKYVVAAKGTNLFFGIYSDESGKRSYDTIPLNIVIEREKEGLSPVPEFNSKGEKLLMYLCPNDLVYVPSEEELCEEMDIDFKNLSKEQIGRIYKMVSCTKKQCFFVQNRISKIIIDKCEYGSINKIEISEEGQNIKGVCYKLEINRLGTINGIKK
ncbi:type II CRISPR RNA-guided endonuclease Cas9 [Marinilabiliaceae bacterium JC040]|nr:type II CRISPR RNA-guided endonuclease Cas9 [Marinilabiliaceae bacterium JC040]